MTTIEDIVSEFRIQTRQLIPWFAPYVFALTPVERPGLGTMAVDKYGRMYYDPDFAQSVTLEQGSYVCLHEAMHLMLNHCHRFAKVMGDKTPTERERLAWNIAADIAVWTVLEQISVHAPAGGVTLADAMKRWPGITEGMTVEEMYAIIMAHEENQDESESDNERGPVSNEAEREDDGRSQEPGEGTSEGTEDGPDGETTGGSGPSDEESEADSSVPPSDSRDSEFSSGRGDDSGSRLRNVYPEAMQGGSGADGIEREYEDEPDPAWGSFVEERALSAVEEKIDEHERMQGTLPGNVSSIVKNRLRPAPDPWKKLAAVVGGEASASRAVPTPTYHVRNRRQVEGAALMKGVKYHQPKVVCVIDTSASMTPECIRKSINAVQQGARGFGRLLVVVGDTEIRHEFYATTGQTEFPLLGGGGTDMDRIIEVVEEKHKPTAIVCCTDGGTGWPERMKARLIVALTDSTMTRWCPDYATVVYIPSK